MGIFDISSVNFYQKSKVECSEIVKTAVFHLLKLAQIHFTKNHSARKFSIQHHGITIVKNPNYAAQVCKLKRIELSPSKTKS